MGAHAQRTFLALLARDLRVLRRDLANFLVRVAVQPLLFVFVFGYVLPRMGAGFTGGGGRPTYTTVLVPGLVASTVLYQGLYTVAIPLVQELSLSSEMEDRVLAPVPVWVLAVAKVVSGSAQALLGAAVVFPLVTLVHAAGQGPRIDVESVPLLAFVLVATCALSACLGLLLGTLAEPRMLNMLFSVVVLPLTMLGCTYYPWSGLDPIPWLKWAVLVNPLVYMSEGLRAALTPEVGHLPTWAFTVALVIGTGAAGSLGVRTFARRVIG